MAASGKSRQIGIVGASGYLGAELLRLSVLHPQLEVVLATGDTQAGKLAASRAIPTWPPPTRV